MRHTWTLKTKKGNEKCGRCGLIREKWGKGRNTRYAYYRGNKPAGVGPLDMDIPKCFEKEDA